MKKLNLYKFVLPMFLVFVSFVCINVNANADNLPNPQNNDLQSIKEEPKTTVEQVSDQEAENAWKKDASYDGSSVLNNNKYSIKSTWTISQNLRNKSYKVHWGMGPVYALYYVTVKNGKITKAYGLDYALPLVTISSTSLTHNSHRAYLRFDFSAGFGNFLSLYNWRGMVDAYISGNSLMAYSN